MIEYKPLPYSLDALEPVISVRTLEFHHGKHLRAYVDNLNKLIAGTPLENLSLMEILGQTLPGSQVFNNAGQVFNHNLYFEQFCPASRHSELAEDSALYKQIVRQWSSIESFKTEFVDKGIYLFGSGWVYLTSDADGNLLITQESNASTPLTKGLKPILAFDLWEHAYYLDYQNRRADHLKVLWQILNWNEIEKVYTTK